MNTGLFITYEGIDGCGKTTQINMSRKWLEEKGAGCVVTREPGGTDISEKIREILLSNNSFMMCDEAEILLYLAARAQHVIEKIAPAMKKGTIVLCDRFQDATFAYQGYGRGVNMEILEKINEFATGGIVPSHTFIFDLPVRVAKDRLRASGKNADRLESAPVDFFERVREGYRALAERYPDRISRIDANRDAADISKDVRAVLGRLL